MPEIRRPPERHDDPAATRPLWAVTGQSFSRRYVVGGDPVDEWTVYFTTRNFQDGQVTILAANYTPDYVASVIEPEAEKLETIGQLRSKL